MLLPATKGRSGAALEINCFGTWLFRCLSVASMFSLTAMFAVASLNLILSCSVEFAGPTERTVTLRIDIRLVEWWAFRVMAYVRGVAWRGILVERRGGRRAGFVNFRPDLVEHGGKPHMGVGYISSMRRI